jgi:hypothetical protein
MSDSNANITRTELVTRAFRRFGHQFPTTDELVYGATTLNLLVKKLDREGRFVHAISKTPYSLTTIASQQSYAVGALATTIPSYITALERVELAINSAPYPALDILNSTQFQMHYERDTAAAQPYACHLQVGSTSAGNVLWLLPKPDSAYTVKIFYRRMLYDFDAASDNPDVPQAMALDLIDALAARLAPDFGTPAAEVAQFHEPMAVRAKHDMRASNHENATPRPARTEYL